MALQASTTAGIAAFLPRIAAGHMPCKHASNRVNHCKLSNDVKSGLNLGRREAISALVVSIVTLPSHGSSAAAQSKDLHLPVEKIKEIIENDIRNGQYYVTGDLTQSIYEDNCRFVDPTTDVKGVDKYVAAIRALFDPKTSRHELLSINVASPHTIQAKWRLEGYIKVPWHPHISPYEGTTVYRLNEDGLIASHEETWDIPVWKAFVEFLTPSFNE